MIGLVGSGRVPARAVHDRDTAAVARENFSSLNPLRLEFGRRGFALQMALGQHGGRAIFLGQIVEKPDRLPGQTPGGIGRSDGPIRIIRMPVDRVPTRINAIARPSGTDHVLAEVFAPQGHDSRMRHQFEKDRMLDRDAPHPLRFGGLLGGLCFEHPFQNDARLIGLAL